MADEATELVEHDSPDAKILVLHNDDTGQLEARRDTTEARAAAREAALNRRAVWEHRLDGGKARAGTLPRLLTGSLAAGVANLMFLKLLQEELKPATAKEAAEVAKIAHTIFREASGQTAGNLNLTPGERAQRLDEVDKLEKALAERAAETTAQLGGVPDEGEPLPAAEPVWEHEVDAG